MAQGKPRASLRQGLDRDIYQILRKLQDDSSGDPHRLTVSNIYDSINRSNSSLRRKPKKLLEDSIDRALSVLKEETGEADDFTMDENLTGMEEVSRDLVDQKNSMNRVIVDSWASGTPHSYNEAVKKGDTPKNDNGTDQNRSKKRKRESQASRANGAPPIVLRDIGGVDNVIRELESHLVLPLLCPEEYITRNIPLPRGILLHGPPGCGKTALSRACATAMDVPFIEILGPSVVSGMSGESEKQIRDHFEEAVRQAPCIIFIDEIDVIANKRSESQSQMEKRIVAQLLISIDSLGTSEKPVIVLAATNRPDSLDPALRRGGRFDTEINMGVPNEPMREQILRAQTRKMEISPDVDFRRLAKMTSGFVGADLRDLVGKAGTWSIDRYREALKQQVAEPEGLKANGMDIDSNTKTTQDSEAVRDFNRLVRRVKDKNTPRPLGFESRALAMEAFLRVLPSIQPSSKREGFATVPDTTWEDIGALAEVRKELKAAIVEPIKNPEKYEQVGIVAPTGVLLWGPPGCGKTLLAKAVANESKANFISVKGPELLNKFVGESERAVRQMFDRARSSVPCVIFLDEVDALIPRRGDLSEASGRVVNTLLTELDGLSERAGIWLIAATNRPDSIDPAMLRPGRLGTLLYVGLPGPNERVEILRALLRKTPMDERLAEVAIDCHNYTGADLGSLLQRAGQLALERNGPHVVQEDDFRRATEMVTPSVADIKKYEKLKGTFSRW